MEIESLQNVNSMDAFMRLVQAARVRNTGFELPVSKVRPDEDGPGAASPNRPKAAGSLSPSGLVRRADTSVPPETPKQILGTRFDAYA